MRHWLLDRIVRLIAWAMEALRIVPEPHRLCRVLQAIGIDTTDEDVRECVIAHGRITPTEDDHV